MKTLNKIILGSFILLTGLGIGAKIGYQKGKEDREKQILNDIKGVSQAFFDKTRYWGLSESGVKTFGFFSDDLNMINKYLQDTNTVYTINDGIAKDLLERAEHYEIKFKPTIPYHLTD